MMVLEKMRGRVTGRLRARFARMMAFSCTRAKREGTLLSLFGHERNQHPPTRGHLDSFAVKSYG